MADGVRTGVKLDYVVDDNLATSDWNNLVKFVDNALARVLVQYMMVDGLLTAATDPLQIDESTGRFTAPTGDQVIAGLIRGRAFYMDSTHESTGAVTNGATTYIEDTSLVNSDDWWNGGYIIFTSGTYSGQVREITDFDSVLGKLTWSTPLAGAPGVGDTYVVTHYYIQSLTNSATNYVYATINSRTPYDQIVEWAANTTGTTPANGILVSTLVLDGSGNVTSSDNNPAGAARVAYADVGAHDVITLTGTISSLAAGGSTQLSRSHSYLLYRGGIEYTVSDENVEITVDEYWKPDEVVFTVENNGSYDVDSVTYTLQVSGWKRVYFSAS